MDRLEAAPGRDPGAGVAARLKVEQRLKVAPQDFLLLFLRERLQPLEPAAGRRLPGHEGPVAAQHDAVRTDAIEQEASRLIDDPVCSRASSSTRWAVRDGAGDRRPWQEVGRPIA